MRTPCVGNLGPITVYQNIIVHVYTYMWRGTAMFDIPVLQNT